MSTPDKDRIALDISERHSGLWLKLAEHMKDRISDLHRKLEGPLTPEETANHRGRIAELRVLLALDRDQPPP